MKVRFSSYSKKIFEYLDKSNAATMYGEEENEKKNYKQTEKSSKITTVHVYVKLSTSRHSFQLYFYM